MRDEPRLLDVDDAGCARRAGRRGLDPGRLARPRTLADPLAGRRRPPRTHHFGPGARRGRRRGAARVLRDRRRARPPRGRRPAVGGRCRGQPRMARCPDRRSPRAPAGGPLERSCAGQPRGRSVRSRGHGRHAGPGPAARTGCAARRGVRDLAGPPAPDAAGRRGHRAGRTRPPRRLDAGARERLGSVARPRTARAPGRPVPGRARSPGPSARRAADRPSISQRAGAEPAREHHHRIRGAR